MRLLNLVTLAQLVLICGLSKEVDTFILIVHFLNHNLKLNHVAIGVVVLSQHPIVMNVGVPLKFSFPFFLMFFLSFCHHSFSLLKRSISFECFFFFSNLDFFQKLSKFDDHLSHHVIFSSNLHHIQMDVTQFSYYHGVLIQFSNMINTTYKWMQPKFVVAYGMLM
jgi:hypothetical protein